MQSKRLMPSPDDTDDFTAELADESTSELPQPELSIDALPRPERLARPRLDRGEGNSARANAAGNGLLRDRYVLEQQLDSGGTAVISRARDLRCSETPGKDAHVVIKQLRTELQDRPHAIARLRREFNQTRLLAHPNIVRVYDLDCDRGLWFISMEWLEGEALGRRLRRVGPPGLPAGEALRIASACGDALAFAHERGVTHGDVKPDNVFVTHAGTVRLIDFGVAADTLFPTAAAGGGPERIRVAATRAYASPEVLSGQDPEPRDDVFSLACMIYEMLAGRHPYGRRGANEARDANLAIEPVAGLPRRQWLALAASLAWRREQRPADAREFLRALGTDVPAGLPRRKVVALAVNDPAPDTGRRWRKALWSSAAVVGVAAAVSMLSGPFGKGSGDEPARAPTTASAAVVAVAIPETSAAEGAVPVAVLPVARPPPPSGTVSFETASMLVSERAVTAAIPVRRHDDAGAGVKVSWRASDGTAVAGRDYGGPGSGVTRLAEGVTLGMIYVPIMSFAQTDGGRSFSVVLTDVSAGATLGARREIVVTIQDDG